jgi:hypothetical protein
MRTAPAGEFLGGLWTIGHPVCNAKRSGHVKRLHGKESIEHLKHLGGCFWRAAGFAHDP